MNSRAFCSWRSATAPATGLDGLLLGIQRLKDGNEIWIGKSKIDRIMLTLARFGFTHRIWAELLTFDRLEVWQD